MHYSIYSTAIMRSNIYNGCLHMKLSSFPKVRCDHGFIRIADQHRGRCWLVIAQLGEQQRKPNFYFFDFSNTP
jgi:hypothetical protein